MKKIKFYFDDNKNITAITQSSIEEIEKQINKGWYCNYDEEEEIYSIVNVNKANFIEVWEEDEE